MSADINVLQGLAKLAECIKRHSGDASALWSEVEVALTSAFGQRLFTALVFDEPTRRLVRVYSNRLDINPVGGCKSVTDSPWVRHVLQDAKVFVGSTREDIRSVFSEYETLWAIGCESVLNIPVRFDGVTYGSLNLLDRAGQYDDVDPLVAGIFGQILVPVLQGYLKTLPAEEQMRGQMEHV